MDNGRVRGEMAEYRFFTACKVRTKQTPSWFIKVKDGKIFWDRRGIDAFAYFKPLDGSKRVIVPIQVKSSSTGRRHFLLEKSLEEIDNILVIVVHHSKTDDQIRQQLYSELGKIRAQKRRMDDFMRKISPAKPKTSQEDSATSNAETE